MDLDAGVERALDLIEAVCRRDVSVTVMACSAKNAADVIIRAMRAGAREFLACPITATSISEAFSRATARHVRRRSNDPPGSCWFFKVPRAAPDRPLCQRTSPSRSQRKLLARLCSSTCILSWRGRARARYCAPVFRGRCPRQTWGVSTRIPRHHVVRHESGLMVLASRRCLRNASLAGAWRGKTVPNPPGRVRLCGRGHGFLLGNIPDILFETANIVYLVVEGNLPALRNARRLISYFTARENAPALEVVLNRHNSRTVEIDEESTLKALSRPVDWKIPNDYMSVRGAQNLGVPLVTRIRRSRAPTAQMANAACRSSAGLAQQPTPVATKGDKWKFWTSNATRPLSTARS